MVRPSSSSLRADLELLLGVSLSAETSWPAAPRVRLPWRRIGISAGVATVAIVATAVLLRAPVMEKAGADGDRRGVRRLTFAAVPHALALASRAATAAPLLKPEGPPEAEATTAQEARSARPIAAPREVARKDLPQQIATPAPPTDPIVDGPADDLLLRQLAEQQGRQGRDAARNDRDQGSRRAETVLASTQPDAGIVSTHTENVSDEDRVIRGKVESPASKSNTVVRRREAVDLLRLLRRQ